MDSYKKIAVLENEIQAQLLEDVLTQRNIPHRMRSYHDSAYDGLFQQTKGWGHVEAPQTYEDEIQEILDDLSSTETPDDSS